MGAGDVTVEIVTATAAAVDTSVTGLRVGANDKWLMCYAGNGQICIVNIEET